MNNRILQIRSALHLTQEALGKKIGITRGAVSKIEKGDRKVTEQVIIAICREFNINENWFRTGEGEMFYKISTDEELAYRIGKILSCKNDFVKQAMLALAKLDEDDWTLIEQLIKKIKDGATY